MSENVRSVLVSAWNAIYPIESMAWDGPINSDNRDRFKQLLLAEAYTEAALMLVPEKYQDDYILTPDAAYLGPDVMYYLEGEADFYAYAETTALAITQAALAAKGTGDE